MKAFIEFCIRRRIPFIKMVLFGFLMTGLSSCISFKTWYGWADFYIDWQVDRFFDVTSKQKSFLDDRLDQLHAWHRKDELPKYAAFLEEVKTRLNRKITLQDILWFRRKIREYSENIGCYIADDVSFFLADINDEQIKHLEEKLADDNDDWQEDSQRPEDVIRQEIIDGMIDNMEEWMGELSILQKKKIDLYVTVDKNHYRIRYQHRITSQQRFITLLKQKNTAGKYKEVLLDWFLNPEQFYSKEYSQMIQNSRNRLHYFILDFATTLTPRQRTHLFRMLDKYNKQIKELADNG